MTDSAPTGADDWIDSSAAAPDGGRDAISSSSTSTIGSLHSDQVTHLVFNGGGGKGLAYFGSLAVLAHLGVLEETNEGRGVVATRGVDYVLGDQITGIAGTSAGGITGALLASGWGIRRCLEVITDEELISEFYDDHTLFERRRPMAIEPTQRQPTQSGHRQNCAVDSFDLTGGAVWGGLTGALAWVNRPEDLTQLVNQTAAAALKPLAWVGATAIAANAIPYVRNLFSDYGLFAGCGARNFLDESLARGSAAAIGDPGRFSEFLGQTFEEHHRIHGIDVVVTGTNIEAPNGGDASTYFGRPHGMGEMRMADALRISMGFPFVYMPTVITEAEFVDERYHGTWIDGGVLNNYPLNAFNTTEDRLPDGVLGFRLVEVDDTEDGVGTIDSFQRYLGAFVGTYLANSEKGQIRTRRHEARTVTLPIEELTTLNFSPSDQQLAVDVVNAAEATMAYFGSELVDGTPLREYDAAELVQQYLGLRVAYE